MAKKPEKPIDVESEPGRALALNESEFKTVSKPLQVQLAESEMDSQISYARRYPRDVDRACNAMYALATRSEESASRMNYAVPRGGKVIEGPSIRFAEVVKQSWGNCRVGSYILMTNREEKYVKVKAIFIDLETNTGTEEECIRGIRDKNGNCFNDDMINITINAALAIAKRNAILHSVPEAAWLEAYEASRKKAAGTLNTIAQKRRETLAAFGRFNISPDKVLRAIGVNRESDLTLDHIAGLRGMWATLKAGEKTPEEMFAPQQAAVSDEGEPAARRKKAASKATLDEIAQGDDEDMKNLNERHKALEDATDAGTLGFHKGLEGVPVRFAHDQELSKAWLKGWQEARDASGGEED